MDFAIPLLNKILPVFVLPLGFALLCISIGLAGEVRALSVAGVTLLWVFSLPPVGNWLMTTLEGPPTRIPVLKLERADAIVVLSGMLQPVEGAPLQEWGDAVDRFEAGVELWKAKKAPILVFTGSWQPWRPSVPPEGEILSRRANELGVLAESIRVTGKVGNTAAEALAVGKLLQQETDGQVQDINMQTKPKIILVTSAFHQPRAAALFLRAGMAVQQFPVDFYVDKYSRLTPLDFLPSADALKKSEMALREWLGRAFYQVQEIASLIR